MSKEEAEKFYDNEKTKRGIAQISNDQKKLYHFITVKVTIIIFLE